MKTKNSGKSSGKFGQKQWEIREKAIKESGKSNGKFGQKQYFFPEIYAVAFRVFSLLLPEFAIAFSRNSGQKQWKNLGKSNAENSESGGIYFGQKLWKFWAISRIDNITFKMYFLDQINILKDLASLCPKFPIYLKILYFRFGRERYEKNCIIGSLI